MQVRDTPPREAGSTGGAVGAVRNAEPAEVQAVMGRPANARNIRASSPLLWITAIARY